jgi:hypothetical protein
VHRVHRTSEYGKNETARQGEGKVSGYRFNGLTRKRSVGIEATGSMQWFLELMEDSRNVGDRLGLPGVPNNAPQTAETARGSRTLCLQE